MFTLVYCILILGPHNNSTSFGGLLKSIIQLSTLFVFSCSNYVLQALSELNDQIPPFPRAEAMEIIEEELNSPAESVFRYISEEPVAAASFGQVGLYFFIYILLVVHSEIPTPMYLLLKFML